MKTIPRAIESDADIQSISTGFPQLDEILGPGGIPLRYITEISGKWSVGKTTLALQIVAQAQQQGIECIWIDAEWSWQDLYARKLGVDTSKLGLIRDRVAENTLDPFLEYIEKGKNTLIVLDAIGAIHTRDEAEKASGDRTIGSQSSLIARLRNDEEKGNVRSFTRSGEQGSASGALAVRPGQSSRIYVRLEGSVGG